MYAHAQAPVRIGIAGGGTDLPAWTSSRVGRCLSLAIAHYTHAVAITRPDDLVVASYRNRDTASCATEIANGLIRESALMHGWQNGFEIHTMSELSSQGSGLGVSSSIAVSLAACFYQLSLLRDAVDKRATMSGFIARQAWGVEIDRLQRPIGRQDHMAAAHGGLRLYGFTGNNAEVLTTFSDDDAKWVAEHLLLVQLPAGHDSRAILSSVKDARMLEDASAAVPVAMSAIEKRDPRQLGEALTCGHGSKRKVHGASPRWINEIVDKINALGCVHGCKVAGAGGGGHVIVAFDGDPTAASQIENTTQLHVISTEPDLVGVRSDGWV